MRRLTTPGAAFLDRDGTINEKAPEGDYIKSVDELRILPGASAAIRRLNDAGLLVIVITNQRGIALGLLTVSDLLAIHIELRMRLSADAGATIDEFLYCPHDVGQCECRKPDIGMFKQAIERFPTIDLHRSAVIGDASSDIEAGRRAGMRGVQLGIDAVDLGSAVDWLLK